MLHKALHGLFTFAMFHREELHLKMKLPLSLNSLCPNLMLRRFLQSNKQDGNDSTRIKMETIRVDVLFGEPVYKKCMIACFMAFHERLGDASRLACLGILDEDIHKFIIVEALWNRRLNAPIGVAIDGVGGIWVSEMHEQRKFLLPTLPTLASELAVTLPDEAFERIAQESVSRVLDELAESVARGMGIVKGVSHAQKRTSKLKILTRDPNQATGYKARRLLQG